MHARLDPESFRPSRPAPVRLSFLRERGRCEGDGSVRTLRYPKVVESRREGSSGTGSSGSDATRWRISPTPSSATPVYFCSSSDWYASVSLPRDVTAFPFPAPRNVRWVLIRLSMEKTRRRPVLLRARRPRLTSRSSSSGSTARGYPHRPGVPVRPPPARRLRERALLLPARPRARGSPSSSPCVPRAAATATGGVPSSTATSPEHGDDYRLLLLAIATLPINLLIYLKLAYPGPRRSTSPSTGPASSPASPSSSAASSPVSSPVRGDRVDATVSDAWVTSPACPSSSSVSSSAPTRARPYGPGTPFYLGVAVPCVFGLPSRSVRLRVRPETAVPLRHHRDVLSEHRHPARGRTEQFQQLRRESVRVRGRRAVGGWAARAGAARGATEARATSSARRRACPPFIR